MFTRSDSSDGLPLAKRFRHLGLEYRVGGSVGLSQAWMLASDGRSKAFDARADGYVRGEGCGVVVLCGPSERDCGRARAELPTRPDNLFRRPGVGARGKPVP